MSDVDQPTSMTQVTMLKPVRMTTTEKQSAMLQLSRLYGDYCSICGSRNDLTIDHINPQSNGGSNELSNLQILCRCCNSRKSDWVFGGSHKASKGVTDEQLERYLEDYEIILKERAGIEIAQGFEGESLAEYLYFLELNYPYDTAEFNQDLGAIPF